MRRLPEHLRDKLKEPIGKLVDEKELLNILKDRKFVVTIGDMVTYTLLKNNISPIFCVVDFKIKRNKYSSDIIQVIKNFGSKTLSVENPPGYISDDLWDAVEYSYAHFDKESIRIEVDGEEDLASLIAIYMAPRGVTVIYGLPNKGVLVVDSSDENKRKVKEILDKM